jgi:CDI immunity proteins
MFSELNAMYWVASTQRRWLTHDWVGDPRENEIYERWCIQVPALEEKEIWLWRPGALSALDGNLVFDEWSYFVGFHATEAEVPDRAARLGLSGVFSPKFYDVLTNEGQLFAAYIDGWWEFCPASDALFARVKNCAPLLQEIVPRNAEDLNWGPQFVEIFRTMKQIDQSKSLLQLDGKDWGEPNFDSYLVTECHRLRRVPLRDFTVEDLRIMIGQDVGLEYLVPLALERLQSNQFAEGAYYPCDLLVSVLSSDAKYSQNHPELREPLIVLTERTILTFQIQPRQASKTGARAVNCAFDEFRKRHLPAVREG